MMDVRDYFDRLCHEHGYEDPPDGECENCLYATYADGFLRCKRNDYCNFTPNDYEEKKFVITEENWSDGTESEVFPGRLFSKKDIYEGFDIDGEHYEWLYAGGVDECGQRYDDVHSFYTKEQWDKRKGS